MALIKNPHSSGKKPIASDLRDSGQIEADAHCIILVHRDMDDEQGQNGADGDADQSARIYALKDALDAADRFESTRLNGPTLDAARRRYRFEIDARFKGGGE